MSRNDPQFKLRLPPDLKARVAEAASRNRRTVTGEVVSRLEQSFDPAVSPGCGTIAEGTTRDNKTIPNADEKGNDYDAVRLREERARLKLSQRQVWEACGVSKPTYQRWEKPGASFPVDKLPLLGRLGMDVLYLATGRRMDDGGATPLGGDESELLAAYRSADPAGRDLLIALARRLLGSSLSKGSA